MSKVVLQNADMLSLLWAIPLLAGGYLYAALRRRRALKGFVDADLLSRIKISFSPVRRCGKAALVLLSLALMVLALTRPGWNAKPRKFENRGREVVFLLDVSKSMLAEDLAPNRLERAKLAIQDCLERLGGDRVGLVAFAGTSVVKCPLTQDYTFFRMVLEDISTDSVANGGTMIGDAIRKTLRDLFPESRSLCRDIILITDGEDHGSFPIEAAKAAGEHGVRILGIGLGDDKEGSRIPLPEEKPRPPVPTGGGGFVGAIRKSSAAAMDEWHAGSRNLRIPNVGKNGRRSFLKYQGQEVRSMLDAASLRQMVKVTPGGQYFHVATGTIDLGAVYQQLVASAEKKEFEAQMASQYEEEFQVFLALALAALALEWIASERRPAKALFRTARLSVMRRVTTQLRMRAVHDCGEAPQEAREARALPGEMCDKTGLVRAKGVGKHLACVGLLVLPWLAEAESARRLVAQGNTAYRAGAYTNALASFEKAALAAPQSPQIDFDKGAALYRIGDYPKAAEAFDQAASMSKDPLLASRGKYNLGNCAFREAELQRADDLLQALASCRKSLRHYREALALDSDFDDAEENFETARLYLNALREELRKQEMEKRKQAEQDRQEPPQPHPDSPQSAGQPNQSQPQTQPNSPPTSSRQNSNRADSKNAAPPASRAQNPSAGNAGQSQIGPARPNQTWAQSPPGGVLQSLQRMQQQAARQLQAQIGQQSGFFFNRPFFPGQQLGGNESQAHEPLKEEPGDILNEEKENREKRRHFMPKAGERPVDKDW